MQCCNSSLVPSDLALRNLTVNGSTSTCRLCTRDLTAPLGVIDDLFTQTITANTAIINNLIVENGGLCQTISPGTNTIQDAITALGGLGTPTNPVTFYLCGGNYIGNFTVPRQGINFIGANAIIQGTMTIVIDSNFVDVNIANNKFSGLTFIQTGVEAVNLTGSGAGIGELYFDNCNFYVDNPLGSAVNLTLSTIFHRHQFNNCRIVNVQTGTLNEIGIGLNSVGSSSVIAFSCLIQAAICINLDTSGPDSFFNNTMFVGRTPNVTDYTIHILNTSENYFIGCYFSVSGTGSGFNLEGGRANISASTFDLGAGNSGAGNLPKCIYSSNNSGSLIYTSSVTFFGSNDEVASTGAIAVASISNPGALTQV